MARTVKCPSCGAELTVKEGNRDFMFCEYCGTKVRLDDYQETHRFVDEAKVKRVEAFKDLAMKKMEMDEQKRKDEKDNEAERIKMEPVYLSLLIALPIIFFILAKLFGAE